MAKVLAVALDALESTLFRGLLADNRLPNFAAFARESQSLDVKSDADILTGGLWPTFATGLPPGKHGIYFWTQWFPEEMRHLRNKPISDQMDPFWSALIPAGQTATIIDVPYVPLVQAPGFRGCVAWGLHDEVVPESSPVDFRGWIDKTYGRHPLSFDTVEPHSPGDKLAMVKDMGRGAGMRARLIEGLAERQDWNFLITSLSEVHMSGHYLAAPEKISDSMTNVDGMVSVLKALDERWPNILRAAGSDCHVMVLALHGMFEQREYEVFGPQVVALFEGRTPVDWYANPDMLRRVRELMPNSLHRAIWRRLPSRIREARQHALGSTTYDFEKDRLFTLVHEIHPAIRFNLRGREAMGFLPPEDADGILDALEEFAVQFTAEDGQQAFTGMWRAKRDQPGPMSHYLPDAMILTNQKIKATHRLTGPDGAVITSNRQEARNGTHNGRGFCYFRPAGSQAATRTEIDVRDFAPSILELLEVSHEREFDGRSFLS
jgi:predicted AlkP superfamily phosphohydrolase/phosphomutase